MHKLYTNANKYTNQQLWAHFLTKHYILVDFCLQWNPPFRQRLACLVTVQYMGAGGQLLVPLVRSCRKDSKTQSLPNISLIYTNAWLPIQYQEKNISFLLSYPAYDITIPINMRNAIIYNRFYNIYRENRFKVRCMPIANPKPTKNSILPIAINLSWIHNCQLPLLFKIEWVTYDASKNKIMPSAMNPNPRHISPIPIFWLSSSTMRQFLHKCSTKRRLNAFYSSLK